MVGFRRFEARRETVARWFFVVTLAGTIGGTTSILPAAAQPPEKIAESFGRLVLEGRFEETRPMLDEKMLALFTAETAEQIRSGLTTSYGAVSEFGSTWLEDRVGAHRRFRVPVRFEKQTLDLRVVLDSDDKVAGLFIVPHLDPPSAVEPPVKEIDVAVGAAETALPGTLALPAGDGPFPAVVLVHGSGPQDRDETVGPNKPFRDLAWGLAQRGIAVLRYDKRSLARPADLVASGDALTVREEVIDDARAALALLRARDDIDAERLFVLGHSLGGTLAPRIATSAPRPAGLIVMAGSTLPLPEKMLEQARYIVNLDGDVSATEQAQIDALEIQVAGLRSALAGEIPPPEGSILGAPVGYYRDLEAHDGPAETAGLGLPCLILQGERDYQVTMDDFGRWKAALAGKPFACLIVYPGLDHLFREGSGASGPADYETRVPVAGHVINDIGAWIQERRCPQ
jgi:dienelactone hydrolase